MKLGPEHKDALRRAFSKGDFILIDGWASKWQREGIVAAVEAGWLYEDGGIDGEQYTAVRFRLTPAGRAALEKEAER